MFVVFCVLSVCCVLRVEWSVFVVCCLLFVACCLRFAVYGFAWLLVCACVRLFVRMFMCLFVCLFVVCRCFVVVVVCCVG